MEEWIHPVWLILHQDIHSIVLPLTYAIVVEDFVGRIVVAKIGRVPCVEAPSRHKDLPVG